MSRSDADCGLYAVGGVHERRALVSHARLFAAHCTMDGPFDPGREAYLSAFAFPPALADYVRANGGSERHYAGPAGGGAVRIDIDRPDPAAALADARKLARAVTHRYPKLDGLLPVYFSGRKGFHVEVELTHAPPPSPLFPSVCRRLAEGWAAAAGVAIDTSVFSRVRLFRLPNTKHPATGRYKVPVPWDVLFAGTPDAVLALARQPVPFDPPAAGELVAELAADWRAAERELSAAASAALAGGSVPTPDRAPKFLLDFLRFHEVSGPGRAVTLFRSAAWLAEAGCPPPAVHALLTEPGLDTGLPAAEVRRQIDCGIDHVRRQTPAGPNT